MNLQYNFNFLLFFLCYRTYTLGLPQVTSENFGPQILWNHCIRAIPRVWWGSRFSLFRKKKNNIGGISLRSSKYLHFCRLLRFRNLSIILISSPGRVFPLTAGTTPIIIIFILLFFQEWSSPHTWYKGISTTHKEKINFPSDFSQP